MATARPLGLLRQDVLSTLTISGFGRCSFFSPQQNHRSYTHSAIHNKPHPASSPSASLPFSFSTSPASSKPFSSAGNPPPQRSQRRRPFSTISFLLYPTNQKDNPQQTPSSSSSSSPSPPCKPSTSEPESNKLTEPPSSKSPKSSKSQTSETQPKTTSQDAKTDNNTNPELPKFDLASLGLSKNMRLLIWTLIAIFGTIETWVWCQGIWHWWKGTPGADTNNDAGTVTE